MDYQTAVELREAGVSQETRKHINRYGTVFWTRRWTHYPAYPIASDIRVIVKEKLREILPDWPDQSIEVHSILMESGAYGMDKAYRIAQVLLEMIPDLLKRIGIHQGDKT